LIANPAVLSQNLGKKVALTGTLEESDSAASTASAPGGPKAPTLRVETGKIVAESCGQ
jgi:hypothetical protein